MCEMLLYYLKNVNIEYIWLELSASVQIFWQICWYINTNIRKAFETEPLAQKIKCTYFALFSAIKQGNFIQYTWGEGIGFHRISICEAVMNCPKQDIPDHSYWDHQSLDFFLTLRHSQNVQGHIDKGRIVTSPTLITLLYSFARKCLQ